MFSERVREQLIALLSRDNLERCATRPCNCVPLEGSSTPCAGRWIGTIWTEDRGPQMAHLGWLYGNHYAVFIGNRGYEISFVNASYAHGEYLGDFGKDVYETQVMPRDQEWDDDNWENNEPIRH